MALRSTFRTLGAVVGWSALSIQLYLLIELAIAKGLPPVTGVMKFFDYFTILSNILVALVFTAGCLRSSNRVVRFFHHPSVKTGIALYIFVTGIVYVLLLQNLWNPTGWQLIADVTLHYIMPIGYAIEWLLFTPKVGLRLQDALRWLAFPLGFAVWALFWGAIFGFYPYPFIDVTKLGYPQVFVNSVLMALGFLVLGLLLVAVDRGLSRVLKKPETPSVMP